MRAIMTVTCISHGHGRGQQADCTACSTERLEEIYLTELVAELRRVLIS